MGKEYPVDVEVDLQRMFYEGSEGEDSHKTAEKQPDRMQRFPTRQIEQASNPAKNEAERRVWRNEGTKRVTPKHTDPEMPSDKDE